MAGQGILHMMLNVEQMNQERQLLELRIREREMQGLQNEAERQVERPPAAVEQIAAPPRAQMTEQQVRDIVMALNREAAGEEGREIMIERAEGLAGVGDGGNVLADPPRAPRMESPLAELERVVERVPIIESVKNKFNRIEPSKVIMTMPTALGIKNERDSLTSSAMMNKVLNFTDDEYIRNVTELNRFHHVTQVLMPGGIDRHGAGRRNAESCLFQTSDLVFVPTIAGRDVLDPGLAIRQEVATTPCHKSVAYPRMIHSQQISLVKTESVAGVNLTAESAQNYQGVHIETFGGISANERDPAVLRTAIQNYKNYHQVMKDSDFKRCYLATDTAVPSQGFDQNKFFSADATVAITSLVETYSSNNVSTGRENIAYNLMALLLNAKFMQGAKERGNVQMRMDYSLFDKTIQTGSGVRCEVEAEPARAAEIRFRWQNTGQIVYGKTTSSPGNICLLTGENLNRELPQPSNDLGTVARDNGPLQMVLSDKIRKNDQRGVLRRPADFFDDVTFSNTAAGVAPVYPNRVAIANVGMSAQWGPNADFERYVVDKIVPGAAVAYAAANHRADSLLRYTFEGWQNLRNAAFNQAEKNKLIGMLSTYVSGMRANLDYMPDPSLDKLSSIQGGFHSSVAVSDLYSAVMTGEVLFVDLSEFEIGSAECRILLAAYLGPNLTRITLANDAGDRYCSPFADFYQTFIDQKIIVFHRDMFYDTVKAPSSHNTDSDANLEFMLNNRMNNGKIPAEKADLRILRGNMAKKIKKMLLAGSDKSGTIKSRGTIAGHAIDINDDQTQHTFQVFGNVGANVQIFKRPDVFSWIKNMLPRSDDLTNVSAITNVMSYLDTTLGVSRWYETSLSRLELNSMYRSPVCALSRAAMQLDSGALEGSIVHDRYIAKLLEGPGGAKNLLCGRKFYTREEINKFMFGHACVVKGIDRADKRVKANILRLSQLRPGRLEYLYHKMYFDEQIVHDEVRSLMDLTKNNFVMSLYGGYDNVREQAEAMWQHRGALNPSLFWLVTTILRMNLLKIIYEDNTNSKHQVKYSAKQTPVVIAPIAAAAGFRNNIGCSTMWTMPNIELMTETVGAQANNIDDFSAQAESVLIEETGWIHFNTKYTKLWSSRSPYLPPDSIIDYTGIVRESPAIIDGGVALNVAPNNVPRAVLPWELMMNPETHDVDATFCYSVPSTMKWPDEKEWQFRWLQRSSINLSQPLPNIARDDIVSGVDNVYVERPGIAEILHRSYINDNIFIDIYERANADVPIKRINDLDVNFNSRINMTGNNAAAVNNPAMNFILPVNDLVDERMCELGLTLANQYSLADKNLVINTKLEKRNMWLGAGAPGARINDERTVLGSYRVPIYRFDIHDTRRNDARDDAWKIRMNKTIRLIDEHILPRAPNIRVTQRLANIAGLRAEIADLRGRALAVDADNDMVFHLN